MALFRRRRPAQESDSERAAIWPGHPFPPSMATSWSAAGVPVSQESALHNAAVWACQRVLVATISMLPIDVVRYEGETRRLAQTPPFIRIPSGRVSRRAWIAQCARSLVSAGNIYGQVVATDSLGRPLQIETIDPAKVSWSGETIYVDGRARDLWPLGDIWHVPASQFLLPGAVHAMSPVEMAKTAIGTMLAAEDFGARFFGDGAHPTKVAYADKNLTPVEAQGIKDAVRNATQGNRETLVLGSGLKLEALQVDPHETDYIDLLRFECEQAARFWGVPPSMIYAAVSGQSVTYSNASQSDLQFLKYSLQPWLVDLEDALSALIAQPLQVKFNTSAILRMDDLTRMQVHELALANRLESVNEGRRLEDRPPWPGDQFNGPGLAPEPAPAVTQ